MLAASVSSLLAGLSGQGAAGAAPLPARHVTVVALPLQNKSGDEDLDWLSLGIQSILEADLLHSPGLNVIPVSRQLGDAEPEKDCFIAERKCWQSLGREENLRIAGQLGADALLSGELTKGTGDGHLQVTLTLSVTGPGAKPESVVVEEALSALPDRLSASLDILLRRAKLPEPPVRRGPGPSLEVWKLHTEALLVLHILGKTLEMSAGDRVEALFQTLGSEDKGDPVVGFAKKLEERLEPLQQALAIAPNDPELWNTAGTAKLLESELLSGMKATRRTLEESASRAPVVGVAFSMLDSFKGMAGFDTLDAFISSLNSSAMAKSASLLEGAAADFRKALDLEPTSISARLGLGRATGNRNVLEEALALNPSLGITQAAIARSFARNGDAKASLAKWQACLAANPRDAECRLGQGEMLMVTGRLDEALSRFIEILGTGQARFKVRAAIALGAMGDGRATAALEHALEKGPPELAWLVLRSLAALDAKGSVPAIRQATLDSQVRTEAVRALGQLGRTSERSTLAALLRASDAPVLELIAALNRMDGGWLDRPALDRLLSLETEPMLEAWLLLRRHPCEECETYLRSELAKAGQARLRQSKILLLLAKVGRSLSSQDLEQLSKDFSGVISLLSSWDKQGTSLWDEEAVLEGLRSGDEVRFAVSTFLIGRQEIETSEEIRQTLRNSLQKGPPAIVPWALQALSAAGRESAELYLRYVESPDPLVRSAALRGLASVDERRAIPFARKALAAKDPDEALLALVALDLLVQHDREGQYCPDLPKALPQSPVLLLSFLGRWASVRCPEGLTTVLPFLGNGDPQVRLAALRAVWRLGGAAVAPRLREAARDPSAAVRALATFYLRQGGEGKIADDVLGSLTPGDWEESPLRTELDLLLPDLLPKLSWEEIRSLGRLTEPNFSALPFSVQTLALFHYATAAPRPAKRLAALEALSRRDAISQSLSRAAILDLWTSAAKALPQEKLADNPYLTFFLADTLKEHGEFKEALVWTRKAAALLPASPAEETVLRIPLAWVEAESLVRLAREREAITVLQTVDHVLLPEISWYERSRARFPVSARTLVLTALAEEKRGRKREARDLLNEAEIRISKASDLDEAGRARERKIVTGLRARVHQALGDQDAHVALNLAELYPSLTSLEREAEESAVVTALQAAIGRGSYEEAHRLTETLALRRYLASGARGFTSASPGRREIVEELRALQVSIQELRRELLDAEMRSAGQDGSRPGGRLQDESAVNIARQKLRDERRRLKQFTVKLKRDHPEVSALLQAEPAEMAQLQSLLRDDQVILQYLLLPETSYLFVLSAADVSIFEIPRGQAAIESWVRAYRDAIKVVDPPPSAQARAEAEAAERELVQTLLAPVLPVLEKYHDLVIVPNGSLHLLPFSALRAGGRLLAERWTISYLSAASLLPVVARGISGDQRLVALANPVRPGFPELPAAESEVEAIRPYFRLAEVYVGEAARKSVLAGRDLHGVNLHLALHSTAGGAGVAPQLVLSDGFMGIEEVWSLYLDGAPLVVLSSCETQMGEQISGDEVVSLGNGFLFAGARRVVASLWPVSGQATRELMKSFYRHLSEGRPAAEALRLAQDDVRQRPQFAAPYYWAAFVLDGW
ncbi:MAG TPA: CHAT domain-containing protein [Thermoanaerobaculia bacterium]|nr:CHAT domain-containing protein [Thermoanaerobaculia bacterium]